MADKRKKRGFFDDIFDKGNFTDIEDIIERMMDKFGIDLNDFETQPFFYGFSVSRHPGEEPEIKEFGNIFPDDIDEDEDDDFESIRQQFRIAERKPLIDVFEIDEKVHVMAELPDVEKEDINLDVTETLLKLNAQHEETSYSESIELPSSVDPDSAKATYLNGVLEVVMDMKELGLARSVHIE
ncbi:archaeal heat shock protein Hsp20 [uncultured Methanolobus sp.]|uniref:archaeal heat shock protein Hsp20 n=1 Tax=uncultured Methanolobus sp. TaxID=218300 RepID=UPI0029C79C77|nr:archaeal heat shock protein Hsp20 [uncultured Methanolobus sp.]